MARPKPWPAPVTMTRWPSNAIFMCGRLLGSGELGQRRPSQRRAAILDVVDEVDQPCAVSGVVKPMLGADDDRAELRLDLGLALAHGEVAPDAAVASWRICDCG